MFLGYPKKYKYTKDKELEIEKEIKNVNDRTWSYWESPNGSFDSILSKKWSKANFCSEDFDSDFDLNPYQYKMLRSAAFYQSIRNKYSKLKNTTFLHAEVKNIDSKNIVTEVITSEGKFQSKKVFNSLFDPKPMINQKKYPVLQQHFVGWFIKTKKTSFDSSKVFFMDFNIPQVQETRFIYVLPIDKHNALVEYTLFSENLLHFDDYETGIKAYLDSKGITEFEIEEKEQGNIPMTCFPFEKLNYRSLLHIGTAGGWTKASTGFTFKNTTKKTIKLINYIKKNKPLPKFHKTNKFWFYDLLLLDILFKKNHIGAFIFGKMFQKTTPTQILKFLDEDTSLSEDFRIQSKLPIIHFIKAGLSRILRLI